MAALENSVKGENPECPEAKRKLMVHYVSFSWSVAADWA